jgi:hypothetical protein
MVVGGQKQWIFYLETEVQTLIPMKEYIKVITSFGDVRRTSLGLDKSFKYGIFGSF